MNAEAMSYPEGSISHLFFPSSGSYILSVPSSLILSDLGGVLEMFPLVLNTQQVLILSIFTSYESLC